MENELNEEESEQARQELEEAKVQALAKVIVEFAWKMEVPVLWILKALAIVMVGLVQASQRSGSNRLTHGQTMDAFKKFHEDLCLKTAGLNGEVDDEM